MSDEIIQKKFSITGCKGFHLPLPNGYSVSVQFGANNYCSNRDDLYNPMQRESAESYTAETAILNPAGDFVRYKKGDVQGYQTPADVFKTILYASKLPRKKRGSK